MVSTELAFSVRGARGGAWPQASSVPDFISSFQSFRLRGFLVPHGRLIPVIVVASLVFLACLGGLAAKVRRASIKKGVLRVTFLSALSMASAGGVGTLFGTAT